MRTISGAVRSRKDQERMRDVVGYENIAEKSSSKPLSQIEIQTAIQEAWRRGDLDKQAPLRGWTTERTYDSVGKGALRCAGKWLRTYQADMLCSVGLRFGNS